MIKNFFLAFVLLLLLNGRVSAQTAADSTGLKRIITNYNTAIAEQSRLYNGPEYNFYDGRIRGNAYVLDVNSFNPGTVNYDGIVYNAPLMYDINKDMVVVLLYDTYSKFSLLKDYVTDFTLLNHHFINIKSDSLKLKNRVDPGFYDELYKGKSISVLAKRTKALQQTTEGNDILSYFDPKKYYYLKKADGYYSFSSQSSLLNILKDKKDELQQFIKSSKIKYKDNPEQAMSSIAAYYDHLTN